MKTAEKILTSSEKFHITLGLERVSAILEILGNPQDELQFIHVAGTNGKGSTCAILSAILSEQMRVGFFSSPHLFSYTERFKINGADIKQEKLDELVNFVNDTAEAEKIELSEFEILTVAGFLYFKSEKVDIVVLETGLGGRLDATNVIRPLVSIITSIGFDHTQRLGDTIEKIGFEKAGIIKEGVPVVVASENLAYETIKEAAESKNSPSITPTPVVPPKDFILLGDFQKENLALALAALKVLPFKISDDAIRRGLKNVKWKFRMEYDSSRRLLVDGCHNPDGARVLRDFLDKNFAKERVRFIYGTLNNKDYESILKILVKPDDELLFYEFKNENCLKFEQLPMKARKTTAPLEEIDGKILTVVCGSLYMLGEIFQAET